MYDWQMIFSNIMPVKGANHPLTNPLVFTIEFVYYMKNYDLHCIVEFQQYNFERGYTYQEQKKKVLIKVA